MVWWTETRKSLYGRPATCVVHHRQDGSARVANFSMDHLSIGLSSSGLRHHGNIRALISEVQVSLNVYHVLLEILHHARIQACLSACASIGIDHGLGRLETDSRTKVQKPHLLLKPTHRLVS